MFFFFRPTRQLASTYAGGFEFITLRYDYSSFDTKYIIAE
jgi:hypothetical protein